MPQKNNDAVVSLFVNRVHKNDRQLSRVHPEFLTAGIDDEKKVSVILAHLSVEQTPFDAWLHRSKSFHSVSLSTSTDELSKLMLWFFFKINWGDLLRKISRTLLLESSMTQEWGEWLHILKNGIS